MLVFPGFGGPDRSFWRMSAGMSGRKLPLWAEFSFLKRGAHKGGLKPQIFRENRGEFLPAKSGLFGANWDLFRAYRGLFGADRDQFLRTPQPRGGRAEIAPKRPFLAQLAPFGPSPPLLSPPLDFPDSFFPSESDGVRVLFGLCFPCWSFN